MQNLKIFEYSEYLLETFLAKSNPYPFITHCVKSVRIRSFSGLYFPTFGLNTDRCSVSLRIQSECVKGLTRKTPNTDTFHAVTMFEDIRPGLNYNDDSLKIVNQHHLAKIPLLFSAETVNF